jgi:hypothetical protein
VIPQQENDNITELIGVYQGSSLFIQNPYIPQRNEFCVSDVYLNGERQALNYNLSALKLDFTGKDLFTPVTVRIHGRDSLCKPVIINPDAIRFHTSFKFLNVFLSDTALIWETEGERERGTYVIEKLEKGFWNEMGRIEADNLFEEASYSFSPRLIEGGNMYRIKYEFGVNKYLYSPEVLYDFYPEPVTFSPKSVKKKIVFSRAADYEIYDQNGKLVLSGHGKEVDVSRLFSGSYIIYFDGEDPGSFVKERTF